MSRNRLLRSGSHRPWGCEPGLEPPEFVPRTEHEETRRLARDWLRERTEDDAIDFEDGYDEP